MARVGVPFGVKGWIKVQLFTEALDSLLDHDHWQIGHGEQWHDFAIEDARVHGDGLVAKLQGIDDRDAAFLLRGREVAVNRDDLPEPETGEYYWSDLIGLKVVNRQGVELGQVSELMETGSHDVLVVRGERERLIPFAAAYGVEVDLDARRLTVDWEADWL
jgi:16S rRNA processing protein RimM